MIAKRLHLLRSQLAGLRRARAAARAGSAWSAVGIAIVLSLAVVFAIDFAFRREVQSPQRAVLILLAIGAAVWAFRKFAMPLLTQHETEIDMALMVERQQQIDSDLVAAIQFEDDVQGRWGSRQLESAVIEYVDGLGKDIDVYQGFNRDQFKKRTTILGVLAAVAGVALLVFPAHGVAFLNRLLLRNVHYPTATKFEAIAVNGRDVTTPGARPLDVRLAEGRDLQFLIRCEGAIPESGTAQLVSRVGSQRNELELKPLTSDERLARVQQALQMTTEARQTNGADLAGPWFETLASLVRLEAPEIWNGFEIDEKNLSAGQLGEKLQTKLPEIEKSLADLVSKWSPESKAALFLGGLPRLNEPVRYQLLLGDAFTDPAEIAMIPLPAVEAKIAVVPPKYAQRALAAEAIGRQTSALVGSEVRVGVECTNKKPLKEVWLTARMSDATVRRFDMQATDPARTVWKLASSGTPFEKLNEDVRFEIQLTDEDGLHLESPIKGAVRLRLDKPPVAIASTVHHVILPGAKPSISYRVGDDFGIKRLQLEVTIERDAVANKEKLGTKKTDDAEEETPREMAAIDVGGDTVPSPLERLPLAGKARLDLTKLKLDSRRGPLEKGDRLHVVLTAEDDRGDAPGEKFRTEPLVIDISDEFGVAAAVGESDPLAEQRVTEIIQRQLGIGESP